MDNRGDNRLTSLDLSLSKATSSRLTLAMDSSDGFTMSGSRAYFISGDGHAEMSSTFVPGNMGSMVASVGGFVEFDSCP